MEELAKILLDHSADKLSLFRMIGYLIHLTDKDIDELEKNPKIVKFVIDSVWIKLSFSYDLQKMKSRQEADEAVMRAIWANYTKGDPVAEEFLFE
uniref:Antitermination protein n=1 Tax=Caenorhabditis tropicalis TaxID=1561998 RepID=A0A1I7TUC1_9PELO